MRKSRMIGLFMVAALFTMQVPVSAADRSEVTYEKEMNEIVEEKSIGQNVNGRMGLQQTSIEAGKTVSFYDSTATMFYVVGGTKVTFRVNLNTSASVNMGYINQNGTWTQKYTGNGSSHNTSFTIPTTGYYRFYVTNSSSKTIKVTGGEIYF